MAYRVLSVNDLEIFYEGASTSPFISLGDLYEIRKELTTTSGPGEAYWNAIYGAHAFYQMATEMNIFGVLPKVTWPRSGWRYLTNWAYTNLTNGYNTYGIGETGTLDSIDAEPEINAVKTAPKIVANSFSVSEVLESLARVDDNWGNIKQLREFGALEHQKTLNMMLGELQNVTDAGYYAPRVLSLDIIITDADEMNANGATQTGYVNANIYGVDRFGWDSTNSKVTNNKDWAIPYVKDAGGAITNQLILDAIVNARKRGGNTNVIMTGYDTYADIQNLYMTYVRYIGGWGETEVQFGVEGIKTAKGIDAGIKVASLYGIPLVPSVNFAANANGKENIYFLDTSAEANEPRLSFSVARPTEYFETADPFINNAFKVRGLYRTIGEVVAKNLHGQAKIYGLQ